jgi:hypothetical protein
MDDGQRIGWGEMASHCQIDQLNLKFEKIEIESPKNYCLLDFFVKTDKIDKKTNSLELTPHETYPLRPPPPAHPSHHRICDGVHRRSIYRPHAAVNR